MAQTKQQKEVWVLVALLLVGALVWYFYFGKTKVTTVGVSALGNYTPINAQDYGQVLEEMKKTQAMEYKSSGRNIFVAVAAPVAPPPSAPKAAAKPARPMIGPLPPPEPPPPQLTMKFFGFGTLPSNGPRRAFLLDGDEVRIVGEGDTVQNHIRITHIGNDRIEYEDVNTGKRNSNTLEVAPTT